MNTYETIKVKSKPKNVLKGSIGKAIEKAERFGTPLVIKDKHGRITEVSPARMKQIVSKQNSKS